MAYKTPTKNSNHEKAYFPKHNIDPKEKDKDWILAYIKAFYQYDRNNNGSIFSNNRNKYDVNLKYSLGQQDIGPYKTQVGCDTHGDDYIGNTNWKIVPIMPKFIDIVVGNMQKQKHNPECNPIDPVAVDAEKQTRYKLRANVMLQKTMAIIESKMNIEFSGPEQEMDPKTFEEIEIHMSLNYKHKMAIAMEEALALILEINDYDSISEHLDRDLVLYGAAVTKDYVGSDGLPKVRRVNPVRLRTLYSKTPNFKQCGAFGEMVTMTMAEFERKIGRQFTKEEKKDIYDNQFSRSYSGKSDNTYSHNRLDDSAKSGDYRFGSEYDDYVITIFDAEFSSTNTDYYETKSGKNGRKKIHKKEYGYKIPKGEEESRKVHKDNYAVWYKGSWIIGTDYIFDHGLVTNMKYEKSSFSDAISSYHVVVPGMSYMNTVSLVERMIPICDDIQLNIIKLRMAVARARSKGLAIEVGALENISKGGGGADFEPLELIGMYNQTGNMLYRGLDDAGNRQFKPMTELENGMADDVMKHMDLINFFLRLMNDATGINNVADGSSPDPDLLKGVAELALQSTNTSLKPLYNARKFIFTETCYSLILRLQESVKNETIKGYARALGETDKRFIEVNKDISLHEFGIKVEDVPSEKERMEFEAMLREALKAGQITIDQYYSVKNVPNLKKAQKYLELVVKRKLVQDENSRLEGIKISGEEQRKTASETQQNEVNKLVVKADQEIRVETEKAKLEQQLNNEKYDHEKIIARLNHHIEGDLEHHRHRLSAKERNEEKLEDLETPPNNTFKEAPVTTETSVAA